MPERDEAGGEQPEAAAHLVALGCGDVRHQPGAPRRLLRHGRQREQGLGAARRGRDVAGDGGGGT